MLRDATRPSGPGMRLAQSTSARISCCIMWPNSLERGTHNSPQEAKCAAPAETGPRRGAAHVIGPQALTEFAIRSRRAAAGAPAFCLADRTGAGSSARAHTPGRAGRGRAKACRVAQLRATARRWAGGGRWKRKRAAAAGVCGRAVIRRAAPSRAAGGESGPGAPGERRTTTSGTPKAARIAQGGGAWSNASVCRARRGSAGRSTGAG